MNIRIKGSGFEVTEDIKNYLLKRLSSLEKFVLNEAICDVELGKTTERHNKGNIFKAEVNIAQLKAFAVSEKPDLYEAIDDVREELEKILTSRKEKKITLFKRGAQKIKNLLRGFRNE